MTRKPRPNQFPNEQDFVAARVNFSVRGLEGVTPYDDYQASSAKRAAILQATQSAREIALDDWADWVEYATELYERGVGPSWD